MNPAAARSVALRPRVLLQSAAAAPPGRLLRRASSGRFLQSDLARSGFSRGRRSWLSWRASRDQLHAGDRASADAGLRTCLHDAGSGRSDALLHCHDANPPSQRVPGVSPDDHAAGTANCQHSARLFELPGELGGRCLGGA